MEDELANSAHCSTDDSGEQQGLGAWASGRAGFTKTSTGRFFLPLSVLSASGTAAAARPCLFCASVYLHAHGYWGILSLSARAHL